jgi:uncharacterized protein YecE (DUF72 family)
MAVEFRAGSWFGEEHCEQTLEFLRQQEIALVCVDEPQGYRSSIPPLVEATSRLGIVRFHGRNSEDWERKGAPPDERFNYLYNLDELKEWQPRICRLAEQAEEVHVIFKNKHQDFPVRNASQTKQLLGISP